MDITLVLGTGAEVALVASLVAGAATTGVGIAQQQGQRRAAKRTVEAGRVAAATQSQQLRAAADEERQRQRARLEQAKGRATVLAVEAGTSEGLGTLVPDQLQRVVDRDIDLLSTNSALQQNAVASGLAADEARIRASQPNPLLSAFVSVMQGARTGVETYEAVRQLNIGAPDNPGGNASGAEGLAPPPVDNTSSPFGGTR
jgi:hypothetical protein